jgi:NAD(P)-dependent dehydrogenase (short-subunit alcohol dehydrogenase family)
MTGRNLPVRQLGRRAGATGSDLLDVRLLYTLPIHRCLFSCVRNIDAGRKVANDIAGKLPPGTGAVQVAPLDLADPASVTSFVHAWTGPLHILINNAGVVMALPRLTRTPTGYEMQFATNHLGHFALTTRLHRWLAAADSARVVSVASIGYLFSPVVFDDLHYRFRPYDQWTSYGQSKSANVLFAVGAARRWADDGIAINAVMPGNVASTALARHMGADDLANFGETTTLALPAVKTIEQGAATSVPLAASPDVDRGHRPLLRRLRRGQTNHRARHPHRRRCTVRT